ncbi:13787_t:CDS:10, partial [Entrophospora sp. SA101]
MKPISKNNNIRTESSHLKTIVKNYQKPCPPRQTKFLDFSEVLKNPPVEGNARLKKRGTATKPIVILDTFELQQIRAQQQQKAKMEAEKRLKPNVKNLYKKVLSWDLNSSGDFPPNMDKRKFKDIPDIFKSTEEYLNIFQPLLILECWQNFLNAKDEMDENDSFTFVVDSAMMVHEFIEIYVTAEPSSSNELTWGDNDLLSMRQLTLPDEQDKLKNQNKEFLTIIKNINGNKITLLAYLANDIKEIRRELISSSRWKVIKMSSLTPAVREYSALIGLPYYHWRDFILNPKKLTSMLKVPSGNINKYMENYHINISQAEAVWKVVNQEKGITLIQGPPGTGKTSTIVSMVSELRNISRNFKSRVLVCAPSNAAVDELEKRFKQGINNRRGDLIQTKVLRFGKNEDFERNADSELRSRLKKLENEILQIEQKFIKSMNDDVSQLSSLQAKSNRLKDEKKYISDELTKLIATNSRSEKYDIYRTWTSKEDLYDADIVCATLAGSGHERLLNMANDFETVIIDEAAQSIELSSLIPLKYNPKRCVIIGDPNQLPPTVLSQKATEFSYDQSLFLRFQKLVPECIHLLNTQYRMHPGISKFPSDLFYNSELKDADGLSEKKTQPWHGNKFFGPYRFFDIQGSMGYDKSSIYNRKEAHIILQLFNMLVKEYPGVDFKGKVGIISPYKRQVSELKRLFKSRLPHDSYLSIDFNTVDGFQGKEKDIIMLSCVRAGDAKSIGFLRDLRRMNVSLTRAKSSLFIVGDSKSLETNENWNKLVLDAKERNLFTNCSDIEYCNFFNLFGGVGGTNAMATTITMKSSSKATIPKSSPSKATETTMQATSPSSTTIPTFSSSKRFSTSFSYKQFYQKILKSKMASTDDKQSKILTYETINSHVRKAEYAVRGELAIRADNIKQELSEKSNKYDFSEIVSCNIGNPQQLDQKPITFFRQVISLLEYPALLLPENWNIAKQLYPSDAIERAKLLSKHIKSVGAYSHSQGVLHIRQNVAKFIEERDGYPTDPNNIFLTQGASIAIQHVLQLIISNDNVGIMIPIPQYPLYTATLSLFNGNPVPYYLDEDNGWKLDIKELDESFVEAKKKGLDVRALVIINPGNPTGQCLSEDNIKEVIEFCHSKRVVILADEVYQANIYQHAERPFRSFKKVLKSMGKDYENFELFSFHSISKGVIGECGKRGGYYECTGINKNVIDQLYKVASISLCPNVSGQIMVDLMVNPPKIGDESYPTYKQETDAIYESLKRRSQKLCDLFNKLEGVTCNSAQGSMYLFPRIKLPPKAINMAKELGKQPDELYCFEMLEATGVCVIPGNGFRQKKDTWHFRSTFLPSEELFDGFCKKIEEFHKSFLLKYSGWELYEEFESEFSPSAVVALFHQKLKYQLPPTYTYDRKVNRKYSCKLTYENEEWETEQLYDRQKDAKNGVAKVALKTLTYRYPKLAITIQQILEMRCKLGPKRLVFGNGVHQMAKNIAEKISRPPSDIWLETQQPLTPHRTLLADFMLNYNLGNPVYVDIIPPLRPVGIKYINHRNDVTISIAKTIADAATHSPPAADAATHSPLAVDADSNTTKKGLFYVSVIVGKRKFNPSKGFEIKPEAQDHVAAIALEILHKEIRSDEMKIIREKSIAYQKSIGRIPDDDVIFDNGIFDYIPSHKDEFNDLELLVEVEVNDIEEEINTNCRSQSSLVKEGGPSHHGNQPSLVKERGPSHHGNQPSLAKEGGTSHHGNQPSLVKEGGPSHHGNQPSLVKEGGPSSNHGNQPFLVKEGRPSSDHGNQPSLVEEGGPSSDHGNQPSLAKVGGPSDHGNQSSLAKEGRPSSNHGNQPSLVEEGEPSSDHGNQPSLAKEGGPSDHGNQSSLAKEGRPSDHGNQPSLVNEIRLSDPSSLVEEGRQSDHGNQSSLMSERRSSDYKNRRIPLYSPSLVEKRSRFYHRNPKDLPLFTKDKVDKRRYLGDRSSLVKKNHIDRRDQLSLAKERRRHLYRRKQSTLERRHFGDRSSLVKEGSHFYHGDRPSLMNKRRYFGGQSSSMKEGGPSNYRNQTTLDHGNRSSLMWERRQSDNDNQSYFGGQSSSMKEGGPSNYRNQTRQSDHENRSYSVNERRLDYEDRSSLMNKRKRSEDQSSSANKRIHLDHGRYFSSKTFIELVYEFAAKTHVIKPRYQILEIKDTDKLDKFYSKMFLNGVEYTGRIQSNEILAKESVSLIAYESI